MEVIYIETKLFEKMMNQFNAFTKQVDSLSLLSRKSG